jgi:acyl-CoA synthetase (AMP-forming)/AMP-acid ligase II
MQVAPLVARARLLRGKDLTLGTLFERLAAAHGSRRLVEELGDDPMVLTFAAAAATVERWSGVIAAGTIAGDRVVVAMPNSYRMLLACAAASRAGAIPVPVNDRMRPDEVDHVIADSGAAMVISDAAELDRPEVDGAAPPPRAIPAGQRDVAALFYTSGTTGKPKGARLTHKALVGQLSTGALWPSHLRRDEAVVALPVAHIMGFGALTGLAVAGIRVCFLPKFSATTVLDAIESRRSTIFIGVPAMYRLMDEAGAEHRDLRSIRAWASGADVMPPDLARKFQGMGATVTIPGTNRNVGEAVFMEGYGMVEVGGAVATRISPPLVHLRRGDALGMTIPGYRTRVVGEDGKDVPGGTVGELWVKGPGVLDGYHGNPEASAAALTDDGWLRTGDLARRGPRGLLFFAGRQKDVIKNGGYSVFAVEVEAALEEHPDVVEAAVVGLPDARTGEVPAAAVRLREGATTTAEELVAWAADAMASYKAPRRILILDDLPRTGTTKVQKDQLRPLFE